MSGDMVHEILEHVDWELLLAHNLEAEKIIEMGLKKSRWMDMRLDVEDIVCEMIGDLLEEMIIGISVE